MYWTRRHWSTMPFTEESRFSLDTYSRHICNCRAWNTIPSLIREKDHCGGGSVMVWAGIMLDSRTPMHVFNKGFLIAMRYIERDLRALCLTFQATVGPEFLLMNDNTPPQLVDNYLQSEDIQCIDWSVRPSDLNLR
ncbi:Transposable element Tcb2 transposase, partial [Stegodyphus mimosarum]